MTTTVERTVSFKDPEATNWDGPHPSEVTYHSALDELAYLIATGAQITAEYAEAGGRITEYNVHALAPNCPIPHRQTIDFDITFSFAATRP